MLKLHVGLVSIVIQCFGILGDSTGNRTKPIIRLLDKFHQNDYKFTFERIQLNRVDKRYADVQCRTYKYNRTTPVTNITCTLKIDVGNATEIIFQMYKFASNEYRTFPVRFQVNFCDAIASSAMGLDKVTKTGNMICPFVKGKKYYVNNFAPDPERFPPYIPNGQYMAEIEGWYQTIALCVVKAYFTVDRPIPIPE